MTTETANRQVADPKSPIAQPQSLMQPTLLQFSLMFYPISIQTSYYYVGWGTLALLNAGIAQAKNRSGLFWFIISVLFGPLATFLVVVLPRAKE